MNTSEKTFLLLKHFHMQNKTIDQTFEECSHYMSLYWTPIQIQSFHNIMRIWRWLIGFNLSHISEKVETIETNMPLIELMQNEG